MVQNNDPRCGCPELKPAKEKYPPRQEHEPCGHIDYDKPHDDYDHTQPPDNPRFPDPRIYGDYA